MTILADGATAKLGMPLRGRGRPDGRRDGSLVEMRNGLRPIVAVSLPVRCRRGKMQVQAMRNV
jgi:hypothetical protein